MGLLMMIVTILAHGYPVHAQQTKVVRLNGESCARRQSKFRLCPQLWF